MAVRLRESDAEQAFEMLKRLAGPEHTFHWEFHDAAETIFFSVQRWPHGQDGRIKDIELALREPFDNWFPPQEDDFTWMIAFFAEDRRCSGVLICGMEF